jgi:hypothetical protein
VLVTPHFGAFGAGVTKRFSSARESRLGTVAGQGHQLVGDGGIPLGAQLRQLALEPAHLGPEDRVLLGYSELSGGDDVTEQGLGHD